MSTGDIVSILVNLAVGIYFAFIYPRTVEKRFKAMTQVPRGFVMLRQVIPKVGILIIVLTVLYALSLLMGWMG